jgi:hypothetical protein
MTNPNMPRQPVVKDPRPRGMGMPTPKPKPKMSMATKMRDGGMAMEKGYAKGGMPMVMKDGKKVPSFAADGKGKMAMGGMATKNKDAAMKHGGMAHGTKAKKGRGLAVMIAIGKPKGRGK